MFHTKVLIYFIQLHLIIAVPQINLYYTDQFDDSESNDNELQHNCLRVVDHSGAPVGGELDIRVPESGALSSYCMSEPPPKVSLENNHSLFPQFTFAELRNQNVTSQQLLLWSAPMDVVERYQFYLNQLSTSSNDQTLATEVFYKCTLPRFGSMCQYELEYYHSSHSSLYELIKGFYNTYQYNPTTLTCYTHLRCDRGPSPACLDWSDICDGQIDCLDGGLDEEHCEELEINQCHDDEYRCGNGQCIPLSFYADHRTSYHDCLDRSDESGVKHLIEDPCRYISMSFRCDDTMCERNSMTSSCVGKREDLLVQALFSVTDKSASDHCWSAFKCIMYIDKYGDSTCDSICSDYTCIEIIERTCPETMFIPIVPLLYGHVYFAYQKNASNIFQHGELQYLYTCYNNTYYDDYFFRGSTTVINNIMCHRKRHPQVFQKPTHSSMKSRVLEIHSDLWKYHQVFNYTSTFCHRSNMYQCAQSVKCISQHRCNNGIKDCPQGDDEKPIHIDDPFSIDQFLTHNSHIQEQERKMVRYLRLNVSFLTVCNGYTELIPITIDGQNETDETGCEQWECNNIYTRCNNFWNCLDGADELDCVLPFQTGCSATEHPCVSPQTNELVCLPIEKANDGIVDCLAATDEPTLCRKKYEFEYPDNFYCTNSSGPAACVDALQLCDDKSDCKHGDDEQFCDPDWSRFDLSDFCDWIPTSMLPDSINYLCRTMRSRANFPFIYFSLAPPRKVFGKRTKTIEHRTLSQPSITEMSRQYQPRCHRGLDLRVWLNDSSYSTTTRTCLCPPNYYGNICQYQNQRVSLAIKLRTSSSSWETPFAIVISLIDDSEQRVIHSHEQFMYLSSRDCQKKFNVYLLYSIRSKTSTTNYSIHVDIYEKVSLTYRGSLFLPIAFPFLPLHRLPFILHIPRSKDGTEPCSDLPCIRGKCIKYSSNDKKISFCHCDEGWSGRYCTIRHNCTCSSGSVCVGVSADTRRSICVCHLDKSGPRCLIRTTCQSDNHLLCDNDGQCIPSDEYRPFTQTHTCRCLKGFTGYRCQIKGNKITLSFDQSIVLTPSIYVHFIQITGDEPLMRATTFLTSPSKQNSVVMFWPQTFHIVFIELPLNNYFLVLVQKVYRPSTSFIKNIKPSDRCPHIRELFNATFAQWHVLRRIKYYQLPCQQHGTNLSCFYDDVHVCYCYSFEGKRLANCFDFHHNMTFDCLGQSECQNEGQCFQSNRDCPQRSICSCPPCFYGGLCQFSTSGFGLSLDAILGYDILPNTNLRHQSIIVQISIASSVVIIIAGLINGILALITFKNKTVLEVGCGLYLLCSSITILSTMVLFGLKFWILILSQIGTIGNRSFLTVQCYSIDFLLRVCLHMDQWLNACVAAERAATAVKGVSYNKKKSRQIAKYMIAIILIGNVISSIHDPIHRRLIKEGNDDDDDVDQRIWCIVTYSRRFQLLNSALYIFHFFGPLIVNLVSAIILITKNSRQQTNLRNSRAFKILLREQFQQHRHLFTAPLVLVVLALPRLIIFFVSKCMKSANDSWLFLLGYFISFIPSMHTFVIFVLPSTMYKKQFHKVVAQYRMNIRRWLHLIP